MAAALAATAYILAACSTQKSVIFDTDWWTDVDDALALRVLRNLQSEGHLELKGICLSAVDSTSIESISGFMYYEGLTDVPLGADKLASDFPGHPAYRQAILNDIRTKAGQKNIDACPDCVELYRSILSNSRGKVDIIAVGFPNALSRLLETDYTLIKRKVNHLWMMAGKYPEGKEHNLCLSPRSRRAGAEICERWPTEITFLGYEVGIQVIAGGSLPPDDLLRDILDAHGSAKGRYAWDPMTVLLAASPSPADAGYDVVRGRVSVNPEDGSNTFEASPDGPHAYVVMKEPPQYYTSCLDSLLRR